MYQSVRDFVWIVYFDPESPLWLRKMAEDFHSSGVLVPVYRSRVTDQEIFQDIRRAVEKRADDVLTTNLDNDDALAADFVSRVQAADSPVRPTAIYVRHGLIRKDHRIYAHTFPRNAFNSVRTSWDSASHTCWSEWHTEFDRLMPVVELGGPAGWMQVVHGSNVSNRVKGRLVSPNTVRSQFRQLVVDVPQPAIPARFGDSAIRQPLRFGRDIIRGTSKRFVVALLGRDGLDRVRAAWCSRSAALRSRLGRGDHCAPPESLV